MKNNAGHSLAELLVFIALLGVLTAIALPAWSSLVQRERQRADVNLLLSAIHYARSQAVQNQQIVTLCPGSQRCIESPSWHSSVLAFIDSNHDGKHDQNEPLLRTFALNPDITWQWSSFRQKPYLQFEGNGTTRALNGTFSLCSSGKFEHQIVISPTGRPRTSREEAGDCNP